MKNVEVNALIKKGIGAIRYRNLPTKEAYKVVKFCLELEKAAEAYEKDKQAIICKVYGERLDAAQSYSDWYAAATKNPGTPRPEDLMADEEFFRLDREVKGILEELDAAEAGMKASPLSFEDFYKLVDQNAELLDGAATAMLKDVLWKDDDDAKKKEEKS